jgi:hypothetical protein
MFKLFPFKFFIIFLNAFLIFNNNLLTSDTKKNIFYSIETEKDKDKDKDKDKYKNKNFFNSQEYKLILINKKNKIKNNGYFIDFSENYIMKENIENISQIYFISKCKKCGLFSEKKFNNNFIKSIFNICINYEYNEKKILNKKYFINENQLRKIYKSIDYCLTKNWNNLQIIELINFINHLIKLKSKIENQIFYYNIPENFENYIFQVDIGKDINPRLNKNGENILKVNLDFKIFCEKNITNFIIFGCPKIIKTEKFKKTI